ncbi:MULTISPECIES: hypothetical protein [unclassified Nocardioides]|uniref:hypothetical protein n=1 Tax=unclassified Nocardioides TaxID=2615069 RepID=UPI0036090AC6
MLCPSRLAHPDDPAASEPEKPATEAPSLPAPERVWACRYDQVDVGQAPDGGPGHAWVRHGAPREVAESDVGGLADAVAGLTPSDPSQMCTTDFGPRWLVVYPHDAGVVGVVVDDFGCRQVRLTDDPAGTAPGEASGSGIVSGVLDGGVDVLAAAGVGRAR